MSDELLDSNILIDFLNGIEAAKRSLLETEGASISVITWIEVMAGAHSPEDEARTRTFVDRFSVIALSTEVAERAIAVRRVTRLKLPDAVIRATALVHDMVLVTRNTKDFPAGDPSIRVPYEL